jgi:hypothetical protein
MWPLDTAMHLTVCLQSGNHAVVVLCRFNSPVLPLCKAKRRMKNENEHVRDQALLYHHQHWNVVARQKTTHNCVSNVAYFCSVPRQSQWYKWCSGVVQRRNNHNIFAFARLE